MNQDQLVQFLNDIYEKECTFKIDEDEIEFIRNGVETLSEKIVNKLLAFKRPVDPDYFMDGVMKVPKGKLDNSIKNFEAIGGKVTKCKKCKFLKVGSFYEGTRNKFPNEFDLIFPLYHLETTAAMAGRLDDDVISISEHSTLLHSCKMTQMKILKSKDLFLECSERGGMVLESNDRSKQLNFVKLVGTFGPALTIQLKYANKNGYEKDIFVDLVAVTTVTGNNLTAIVNEHCVLEPLKDKIRKTGRVLVVKKRVSFTETEVDVIKGLSQYHKMVYKLLKYFIHGDDDSIRRTNLFNQEYSSYLLKIFMIHHHYICSTDVTQCSAGIADVTQCSADTTDIAQCSVDTNDVAQFSAATTDVTPCFADTTNVTKFFTDTNDFTQCSGDAFTDGQCQGHNKRESITIETRMCSNFIGRCLLTILDEICKHENTDSLPTLSKKDVYATEDKKELFLSSYLKVLRDDLRSVLNSTNVYDYDRLKRKHSFARSINARYNLDHPTETGKRNANQRKQTTRKFPTLELMRERGLLKKH